MWKRRGARALRAGRRALGRRRARLLPLLELTGTLGGRRRRWGYLALLLARPCAWACDRYFGLTSGWMRDVATAQAVQRRLEALQFDWASESVREVLGPAEGTAGEAAERCLAVLRRFTEDVAELVRTETADWMVEFGPRPAPLRTQSAVPCGRTRPSARPAGARPAAAGDRPNMPRQRAARTSPRPTHAAGSGRPEGPAAGVGPAVPDAAPSPVGRQLKTIIEPWREAAGRRRVQAEPDVPLAGERPVAVRAAGCAAGSSSSVGRLGRRGAARRVGRVDADGTARRTPVRAAVRGWSPAGRRPPAVRR